MHVAFFSGRLPLDGEISDEDGIPLPSDKEEGIGAGAFPGRKCDAPGPCSVCRMRVCCRAWLRRNHLSNTTCITHACFKSGE